MYFQKQKEVEWKGRNKDLVKDNLRRNAVLRAGKRREPCYTRAEGKPLGSLRIAWRTRRNCEHKFENLRWVSVI